MPHDLRSQAASFGLSPDEFDGVVGALGRQPNALEAAMFGALWSEHCGYKNSRALLRRLPTTGPQVLQGPGENAGVVDIGEGWGVAFKMESHNHPSAVEPVQGAATGVGGILRDIFAMGARPFATLNALRFGEFDTARNRYLLSGVVQGIALYGNAIGVPTVGGEIETNACYTENPLVNVMALGLLRHEELQTGTVGAVGNSLLYVGSKTGRDGLGGAVFASADLSSASGADRPAVQVGDPFMEKLLLEACLEAYAAGLVAGVQDMGAAGLTSSVGEMAHRAGLGVDLHVDKVPTREAGMAPLEIMLSESQERMVLTAAPGKEEALVRLLAKWELEAVEVGCVVDHGRFRVFENGAVVADMPVPALNEPPEYVREGVEDPRIRSARERDLGGLPVPADPTGVLLKLLASPTIASKRPVYEQFDQQVMTNTVVLPGAADAAVMRVKGSRLGVAATVDCNSRYVYLDPELGAMHAVAEAARNLSCVGARPLAVTDNLNFGNPLNPGVYYQLERAVDGLARACLELDTPVIGGNVSLYNEFSTQGGRQAIHPTPTVGMVGVLRDVGRHAGSALRRSGDVLLVVGPLAGSLGASEYLWRLHGLEAGRPPELDLAAEAKVQAVVRGLVEDGLCDTAHDTSQGGLAVALAEMCLPATGAALGLTADLGDGAGARLDELLFGEAASRVVLALRPSAVEEALARCSAVGVAAREVGHAGGDRFTLRGGGAVIDCALEELRGSYEATYEMALR
ncbi:MAG: phosphoribosylformylglycinamidine synthase subunit PurL [Truepera sp.]|nr:phosphoribosylformylglycinamidine synthase subunit PurL [Truepera sp.]